MCIRDRINAVIMKYSDPDIAIHAGIVIIQVVAICFITSNLTVAVPLAIPTPITEPTRVWVGDIGNPIEAKSMVILPAEICAENPLVGTNSVIRLPIVPVILFPAIKIPSTSAIAPRNLMENPRLGPTVTLSLIHI